MKRMEFISCADYHGHISSETFDEAFLDLLPRAHKLRRLKGADAVTESCFVEGQFTNDAGHTKTVDLPFDACIMLAKEGGLISEDGMTVKSGPISPYLVMAAFFVADIEAYPAEAGIVRTPGKAVAR